MDITPAPVSHTILGYRASGTSRRQLFSPEYSHRSPGSYECTHLGLGRLSDTARAPDPRPEIIYTSPQSDFLSSGYEIITTRGRKSSKGLYERLACSPVLPYREITDATTIRRLPGVRDTNSQTLRRCCSRHSSCMLSCLTCKWFEPPRKAGKGGSAGQLDTRASELWRSKTVFTKFCS